MMNHIRRRNELTQGPVSRTILSLTAPMVVGIFSLIAFNLADTFFVARLGTEHLAAISFTFPVVMVLGGIAMGLGTGTASVVSRAVGSGDSTGVRRVTTDALILAVALVAVLSVVGYLAIDPVFTMLGADAGALALIREYMAVWYLGMVFVVVPMVGNNVIRATGDTMYPSMVMCIAAFVNVILDPILIFGLLGLPAMGLRGAALATVIARATSCAASLGILYFRERLIDFRLPAMAEVLRSWRRITWVGIPATGTFIIMPASHALITRLASEHGQVVVAALGAGIRVTSFAMTPLFALGSAMVPFVGQNWGSRNLGRVRRGQRVSLAFAAAWGAVATVGFWFVARPVADVFSREPAVLHGIRLFLWVVPLSFAFQGASIVATSSLNAINRPLESTGLTLVRMFGLCVPLAWLGSSLVGPFGLFAGLALGDIIGGSMAAFVAGRTRDREWDRVRAREGEQTMQAAAAWAGPNE